MNLDLLSHNIEISFEFLEGWTDDRLGRCDMKTGQILIRDNMPFDSTASVLLHEVVHLIGQLNGFELTEQTVDGLALGIMSFIRNNPKVIEEFIKRKEKNERKNV